MATSDGSIIIDLKLEDNEMNSKLSSLEGKTSSFASNCKKALVGIGVAKLAKEAIQYCVEVGSKFEASMSKVQAISGATGDELAGLEQVAKDLGSSTMYSASEVADGMTELAKAGWTATDIMEGMNGVVTMAIANDEDLANVSTIVANSMNVFGIETSDASRVADLFTQAAHSAAQDVNDLQAAMEYVGPIANTMGFSIEDTTVAVTALAKSSITGGEAGTSLRRVLTNLTKPTATVTKALNELGIQNEDLVNGDGSFKSLDEILSVLRGSFDGLTDEQKAYYATCIAGQTGQSGLLALLNMSQEEYDDLSESLKNCDGVAQNTADTMADNLAGDVKAAQSAMEGLGIEVYDNISPGLRELVQIGTDVIRWCTDFIGQNFDGIISALETIGAVVVAWKVGSTLDSVVGSVKNCSSVMGLLTGQMNLSEVASTALSTAQGVLNKVMNANPIALVVTAITALVAAFIWAWNNIDGFKEFWMNLWDTVVNFFSGIVDTLVNFFTKTIPEGFNKLKEKASDAVDGVVDFFSNLPGNIKDFLEDVISNIKQWGEDIVQKAGDFASDTIDAVGDFFSELPGNVKDFLDDVIDNIKQWGSDTLSNAGDYANQAIQKVGSFFQQLPGNIWNFLNQTIQKIISWGSQTVSQAGSYASQTLSKIGSFFQQLPGNIWNFLNQAIQKVISWGSQTVSQAGSYANQAINKVGSFFSQLPSKLGSYLTNAVNKVISWGSQLGSKAISAGRQLISGITNTVSSLPSKMGSIGTNLVKGLWNGISNVKSWILGKISGFCSSIVGGIKGFFGIKSPSKLLADEVGEYLPAGITVGFEANMPEAEEDMLSSIDDMVADFNAEVNDTVLENQGNGDYSMNVEENIDYIKLGNEVANALSKANMSITINNREMGRLITEEIL